MLTNMYQEVVETIERQFALLTLIDYKENMPNEFYSCIKNFPKLMSVPCLLITPFVLGCKSKRLNYTINVILFMIKMGIPLMIVYLGINLVLAPLVYLKILFCILIGRY